METISNIVAKYREQAKSQTSLQASSQRTMLSNTYGTKEQFLRDYNPDVQMQICTDSEVCFFGAFPTLAKLKGYGTNTPVAWLLPQLFNLSEFCGCKDKLQPNQIKECAMLITANYYYLKVSELMLFFFRFKSGRYGRFYGSVDPLIIMQALKDFVKERNIAIDRHEQEKAAEKRLEDSRKHAAYLKECKRKGIEPYGGRLVSITRSLSAKKSEYTKEQITHHAKSLVENVIGYSEQTLAAMKNRFVGKFHTTPEEWLNQNDKI